jgi:hypothetical protein
MCPRRRTRSERACIPVELVQGRVLLVYLGAPHAGGLRRSPMPPASETRNLREEIPEDLEQLSRVKLQALAKTHGIKANKKNADIIADLRALAEEQHRPDEPVNVC